MSDIILTSALPGAPIRNFTDFINQHAECHRPAVESKSHLQAVWFYENETFDQYKANVEYVEGKSMAISVRPEPDLWGDMTPEWFASFAQPAQVSKVIVFTLPESATNVFDKIQAIADTSDVLFYDDVATMKVTNNEFNAEIDSRLHDYSQAHPFIWNLIDMYKLLNKDRAEYERLVNLLGLEPLDDWKARIDQIVADWF